MQNYSFPASCAIESEVRGAVLAIFNGDDTINPARFFAKFFPRAYNNRREANVLRMSATTRIFLTWYLLDPIAYGLYLYPTFPYTTSSAGPAQQSAPHGNSHPTGATVGGTQPRSSRPSPPVRPRLLPRKRRRHKFLRHRTKLTSQDLQSIKAPSGPPGGVFSSFAFAFPKLLIIFANANQTLKR